MPENICYDMNIECVKYSTEKMCSLCMGYNGVFYIRSKNELYLFVGIG